MKRMLTQTWGPLVLGVSIRIAVLTSAWPVLAFLGPALAIPLVLVVCVLGRPRWQAARTWAALAFWYTILRPSLASMVYFAHCVVARVLRRPVPAPRHPVAHSRAHSHVDQPGIATTPPSSPIPAGGPAHPSRGRFEVVRASALPTLAAIGGMQDLKAELRETVGLVLQYPREADVLKVEHGGILLYGPPGVGKTAMAKSVAGEFGLNFVGLNGGNLSTEGLLGVAAQKIGEAFETAESNLPCLLFIDELETVAPKRGRMNTDNSAVGSLLTALTAARVHKGQLVIMAATNLPADVDEAVRRPGRFDTAVEVKLPDGEGRIAIMEAKLSGRPVATDVDLDELARRTEGWSGAKISVAVERAALLALKRRATDWMEEPVEIRQGDLLDGITRVDENEISQPAPAAPSWLDALSSGAAA